jgi:ABC-type lipoprotein export system ATPase subunit
MSGEAPPAIHAMRLSKTYRGPGGDVHALRDVDLVIAPGELLCVVGRSGSGKSTLLHLLGGLDVPTAGEVRYGARSLATMPERELTRFRRRRIGFVFQAFNLLPGLSAIENVALPRLLDGQRARDVLPVARHLLDVVGLGGRAAHAPSELSGGEIQRVAIARAMVTDPDVILADEPTGNLDRRTADDVVRLIRHANRAFGRTVVLVTHDAGAAAHGDRTIVLEDGRIRRDAVRNESIASVRRLGR